MSKSIIIFTMTLLLTGLTAKAGSWSKLDSKSVVFNGNITAGEYQRFLEVFDANATKTIYVNSGGGLVDEGLKIGRAISGQPIKIVVNGWCLSSCANYIFTAGAIREIHGIVGFHGNTTACFTGNNQEKSNAALRTALLQINPAATEAQIREAIDYQNKQQNAQATEEAELLTRAGVSQALFDLSCTEDKGAHDGKKYAFLLPSKETFEKYGYKGIIGEQNQDLANGFFNPVLIK